MRTTTRTASPISSVGIQCVESMMNCVSAGRLVPKSRKICSNWGIIATLRKNRMTPSPISTISG
jgi:hypothetical protein